MGRPQIFCTVNAGTGTFTNITIKSILQFHPKAKVFVFDVIPDSPFRPIDKSVMSNVEVLQGICRNDFEVPKIDPDKMSEDDREILFSKLDEPSRRFYKTGDFHHSANIQHVLDTVDDNFVLVDSDAPLTRPIDFFSSKLLTVGTLKFETRLKEQVLLSRFIYRFFPFVQYFNVKRIREFGINYYNDWLVLNNPDLWYILHSMGWGIMLNILTGGFFAKQIILSQDEYMNIDCSKYIDHFGGGSWDSNENRQQAKWKFYGKYQHLFRQRLPYD